VNGTYVFSRSLDGETLVIALNVSESTQQASVIVRGQSVPQVIFGEASDLSINDGRLHLKIPPRCGAILK
jgi:hypothetical protein